MSYVIEETDTHPSTVIVIKYLDSIGLYKLQEWSKIFNKCSDDNKLVSMCKDTVNRLIQGKKVKERDLLALAWTIRFDMYDTLSNKKI